MARGYLAVLIGLLTWSVAPAALGWTPSVVLSASMEPRIRSGDVVVFRPVAGDEIDRGQVVLYEDPAHPGRRVTHRVAERHPDGTLRTRGDANAAADSSPLPTAAVQGSGSVRVPLVGLPVVWARDRQVARLFVFAVVTACAVLVTAGDATIAARARARRGVRPTRHGVRRRRRRTPPAPGTAQAIALVVSLTAVAAPAAHAAWSATTSNAGSTIDAATSFCVDPGPVFVGLSAETYVEQAHPDHSNGPGGDLVIDSVTGGEIRTLVGYGLPAIPDRCTVASAHLRLYVKSGHAGRVLHAHRAASAWSDTTVTWNTQPATTGPAATAPSAATGHVTFDVTGQVLAQYAGPNHGLVIRDAAVTDGHIEQIFYSMATAAPDVTPTLRVVFQ